MKRIIYLFLFCMSPLLAFKIEDVIAQEKKQEQQQDLTVDLNLHGGKVLVLSDGSTWEVAPQSLTTSQSWIFPAPLMIEKSGNSAYPCKIINKTTQSYVLVRPIASQSS
ncbi:MAG: hypothetical protein AB7N99_07505 [Simkaniaceae bacterium]